jgi:hypothetical protein
MVISKYLHSILAATITVATLAIAFPTSSLASSTARSHWKQWGTSSPHQVPLFTGSFSPRTILLLLFRPQPPLHLHLLRQRMEQLRNSTKESSHHQSLWFPTWHTFPTATLQIGGSFNCHIGILTLAAFSEPVFGQIGN